MAIIISHITAAQLFSISPSFEKAPLPYGAPTLDVFAGKRAADLAVIASLKQILPTPIHILTAPESSWKRTRTLVPHTFADAIEASELWRLTDNVLICAPAWSFVQAAQTMRPLSLALYGYLLCGTHALADIPGGLVKRPPLTNVRDIRAFTERHAALKGIKSARCAAQWLLDGSASPMESALALRFALPRSKGGLGIDRIELNHRIDLTERQRAVACRSCYRIDVFLPDVGIGIEYDSDAFHAAADKIARDALRRNILESLGIRMLTVTRRQLLDAEEFRIIADSVYELMGKRQHKRSIAMLGREEELARKLRGALSRMRPAIPSGIVFP